MGDAPVFATAHLAAQYPRAKDMRQQACGLLAVAIPKAWRNFIMWFRPEEAQTKVWAGNPDKQVTRLPGGTIKIEPRQSFEAWKQAVTLRARPWTQAEIKSALAVRNELMALDLQRQFALARCLRRAFGTLCAANRYCETCCQTHCAMGKPALSGCGPACTRGERCWRLETRVRVSRQFERADVRKEAFGLGLGLHICKSTVELHGGQIQVLSERETGTVFSVILPVQN